MKKGNMVNLLTYQDAQQKDGDGNHTPISKELEEAIESLITQLRDIGPLEKKSDT